VTWVVNRESWNPWIVNREYSESWTTNIASPFSKFPQVSRAAIKLFKFLRFAGLLGEWRWSPASPSFGTPSSSPPLKARKKKLPVLISVWQSEWMPRRCPDKGVLFEKSRSEWGFSQWTRPPNYQCHANKPQLGTLPSRYQLFLSHFRCLIVICRPELSDYQLPMAKLYI